MTTIEIIEMISNRMCENCVKLEINTVLSAAYFDECDTDAANQYDEAANLCWGKALEFSMLLLDICDEMGDYKICYANKIKANEAHIKGIKEGLEETEGMLSEERKKIFESRIKELQAQIEELQAEG